ncbi:MAG: hypothetical protein ABIR36_12685 [Nitrospiraceae bacterium]
MPTTSPSIIHTLFPDSRTADDAFIRDGMSPIELRKLHQLVIDERPDRVLEIGMANGTAPL